MDSSIFYKKVGFKIIFNKNMALETIPVPEKQTEMPLITNEEFLEIFGGGEREIVEEWLEEKGIEPDEEGYIKVNIEGQIERVDVVDDIGKFYEIEEDDLEN